MSIPNLITLARILAVPVILWAIISGEMRIAFALFLAAGLYFLAYVASKKQSVPAPVGSVVPLVQG